MRVKHRYQLRTKEKRALVQQLEATPTLLHRDLTSSSVGKTPVELVVLENRTELYLIDERLWLVRTKETTYPSLHALLDGVVTLPKIVVDMGAVPHIANGADVMGPGIVAADDSITEGDIVVVVDQKSQTPLAVGRAIFGADKMSTKSKGRAVTVIMYVGDWLWDLMKSLST
ncbi:MAG: PUA domain-containing protein [Promethearchaeota archaeon]